MLPVVLVVLLAMLVLAAAGLQVVFEERAAGQAHEAGVRAYWAAKAGIAGLSADADPVPEGVTRVDEGSGWRAESRWDPLLELEDGTALVLVTSDGSASLPPGEARRTLQAAMLRGYDGSWSQRPQAIRELFAAY